MPPTVASLVVADLITSGRDAHPLFDARRHPDRVLLRALSRYQRRLVSRVTRVNNKFLVATLETALPLADFSAGITLPDYKYPMAVEVELPATTSGEESKFEVDLVSRESRLRYNRAAYLYNNTLYLTGNVNDWVGFTFVRFFYVAEVDALTTFTGATGTLVLPNAAEPCLVAYLASFMASRTQNTKDVEAPNKGGFRKEWRETEQEFLDEMTMHSQAEVSVVREVF